jgi:hypothetical protein
MSCDTPTTEAKTWSSVTSPQQLEAEALARALWAHPLIAPARQRAIGLMLGAYGIDVPAEAMARFSDVMDEYTVSYLLRAISSDPHNPRIIWTYNPPFERDGQKVLGSRFCGDNPDSYYRFTGIDPASRYRIIGRPAGPECSIITFTLMRNWGGTDTGANLDLGEVAREPDGSFVITVDADPAGDRPNHLRTDPAITCMIIRENMGDWALETPLHLSVEREGAKLGAPADLDAMAALAARWLVHEIPLYFWMIHLFRNLEPNTVRPPRRVAEMGGHASHSGCSGFCQFKDDEAIVVQWDPADAAYASITVNDWWFRQIDAHRIQSSLTSRAAQLNPDGTITAVIAARDPGIVNWLETGGLHDVTVNGRWQGLPADGKPTISFTLTPLADLDVHLPAGTVRISPEERVKRNQARLAAFARRIGSEGFVLT